MSYDSCQNCRFARSTTHPHDARVTLRWTCRVNPPVVGMQPWPIVGPDDWCAWFEREGEPR